MNQKQSTLGIRGKLSRLFDSGLAPILLSLFVLSIFLVLFLDFFDIEAFVDFNQTFLFDLTWKGRMFYLFFAWLLFVETILDWDEFTKRKWAFHNRFRIVLAFVLAVIPLIYILSVNFLGLDQTVLDLGQALNIRPGFITSDWPLSLEYLILATFFIFATLLAYGFMGLKTFSISLSLLTGIGLMYLADTVWPFGTLKPMQLVAVPTAAFATALLDLLGYSATLTYPASTSPEYGIMPLMTVSQGGKSAAAHVAWPCAGVHSLLLFVLITLVFFKKTTIRKEWRITYFLIGAIGTYLANILRIASFFTISIHYGAEAGLVFHNSYGELYFMAWIIMFLIAVIAIQSGKISKITSTLREKLKIGRSHSTDENLELNQPE